MGEEKLGDYNTRKTNHGVEGACFGVGGDEGGRVGTLGEYTGIIIGFPSTTSPYAALSGVSCLRCCRLDEICGCLAPHNYTRHARAYIYMYECIYIYMYCLIPQTHLLTWSFFNASAH